MKRKTKPKIQNFVYENSEPVFTSSLCQSKESNGIILDTLLTMMKISSGVYLSLFTLIIVAFTIRILA